MLNGIPHKMGNVHPISASKTNKTLQDNTFHMDTGTQSCSHSNVFARTLLKGSHIHTHPCRSPMCKRSFVIANVAKNRKQLGYGGGSEAFARRTFHCRTCYAQLQP